MELSWTKQESGQTAVQKYKLCFSQQLTSQSGKQLQGAGTPRKPRDVEHLTKLRYKWAQDVPKM
jgi:hypothetical protein